MATAAGAGVGHSRAVSLTTVAFVVALPKRQRMGWCWSARRPPPPMRTVEVQPSAVPVGVAAPIQGGDAGGGDAGGGGAGGDGGGAPSAQRIAQAAIEQHTAVTEDRQADAEREVRELAAHARQDASAVHGAPLAATRF